MSKQDKAALRYLNTQCITNYTQKMRIIGTLKHDVPNLRLDNCKFITAGLRMYYNNELNDEQINAIQQFLINQDFIDYGADKTGISIWFNDQKHAEKMKQKVISILETLN